ncbi:MAG TPA: hypothetical protein VKE24_16290 [Candidatus Acidoferrales bacterium]|nr:hypothetical protein [Candidatus Acidoferrales bacterium]
MPLPETIPVRYTEEEAEYLSVRPVVRQTFRFQELIDMVLGVTGKDIARIQQILRAGTVVFHFYRYWWQGFEVDPQELARELEQFPDADPARPFRAEECTVMLLESGGEPPRHSLEIARASASRKGWFRSRSLWDGIVAWVREQAPTYRGYSYPRRADLYQLTITPGHAAALHDAFERAPRELRRAFLNLPGASRIVFLCPRQRSS